MVTIHLSLLAFFIQFHLDFKGIEEKDHFIGIWQNEEKTIRLQIVYTGLTYDGNRLIGKNGNPGRLTLIQMKRRGKILYGGTYRDYFSQEEHEAKIRLLNDSVFRMKVYDSWFGTRSKWYKTR